MKNNLVKTEIDVKNNNDNFNFTEFSEIKINEVGYPSFTLSPKRWIQRTNAIGIYSKGGNIVLAHLLILI